MVKQTFGFFLLSNRIDAAFYNVANEGGRSPIRIGWSLVFDVLRKRAIYLTVIF